MKFLILKTQNPEPHDVRFRVFLEDGTELHGARRVAISGQPEQHFVTRHSIDENLPGMFGRGRTGSTPLIAAMRAFVAEKLGDEVEL